MPLPPRAPTISNARALDADQTKDRSDLALVPALDTQLGIAFLTLCVCQNDSFALAVDQLLLRCGQQRLAFGQTHSEWIRCQFPVDGADLYTLGTTFVINQVGFDDHSHDGPPNSTGTLFWRTQPTYGLPPLWPALLHAMARPFQVGHDNCFEFYKAHEVCVRPGHQAQHLFFDRFAIVFDLLCADAAARFEDMTMRINVRDVSSKPTLGLETKLVARIIFLRLGFRHRVTSAGQKCRHFILQQLA